MTLSDKKNLKRATRKTCGYYNCWCKNIEYNNGKLEIEEITVSEYDNLEGLICQKSKMY